MLTKENDHRTKVGDVDNMNKNKSGKEICRLKKKNENVVNYGQDIFEVITANIVVKEINREKCYNCQSKC